MNAIFIFICLFAVQINAVRRICGCEDEIVVDDGAIESDEGDENGYNGENDSNTESGENVTNGKYCENDSNNESDENDSNNESDENDSNNESDENDSNNKSGVNNSNNTYYVYESNQESDENDSKNKSGENNSNNENDSNNESGENDSNNENGENDSNNDRGENDSNENISKNKYGNNNSNNESGKNDSNNESGENDSNNESGENDSNNESGENDSNNESGENDSNNESGEYDKNNESGENDSNNESSEYDSNNENGENDSNNDRGENDSNENISKNKYGNNNSNNESGKNDSNNESGENDSNNESGENDSNNESGENDSNNESGEYDKNNESGENDSNNESGEYDKNNESGENDSNNESGENDSNNESGENDNNNESDENDSNNKNCESYSRNKDSENGSGNSCSEDRKETIGDKIKSDAILTAGASVTACVLVIQMAVLPLVCKYSKAVQRKLVFSNCINYPRNLDYDSPSSVNIIGGTNCSVEFFSKADNCDIKLGIWHIIPCTMFNQVFVVKDYATLDTRLHNDLKTTQNPVVLYCHGNSNHRGSPHRLQLYKVFQELDFHVVAFDYRGYGDSTHIRPTERGVVEDCLHVYRWLIESLSTENRPTVILWGHSLGTAVASNLVAHMSELCSEYSMQQLPMPDALVLEGAFNNLPDEIQYHPFSKWVSWLPYYKESFVKPFMGSKEYAFTTDQYLTQVPELPILMLHCKGDRIVPYELAVKLQEAVSKSRARSGAPLVLHTFEKGQGLGHNNICESPELPLIVRDFMNQIGKT